MPRAVFAIVALLLAAACSTSSPHPATAPSDPVARADAKLFSGDYDGALAAYQKLFDDASSGSQIQAHARAHYATLLDYLDRFPQALDQAQQAVQALDDSDTEGRLTRALDWGEDIPGAIAAGGRAVAAKPVVPLSRVYYSEALADGGRYADARAQLLLAEAAASDPYTRAEVEREWANYYRGKGDPLEELNHLELSVKAQPGFPERTIELARHDYVVGKGSDAGTLLERVARQHPKDYGLANVIADTAYVNSAGQLALGQYQRALQLEPNGPEAALGEAEVEADGQRSFSSAHDILAAALKADPKQAAVAEYLYWLDQLVLKTDGGAELKSLGAGSPDAEAGARQTLMDAENALRKSAGLDPVVDNPALDQAAVAHAYYFLFNFGDQSLAGTGVHSENAQLPGYSGAKSAQRAQHFGYSRNRGEEVIAHAYLASGALSAWSDSVYHRLGLLDPEELEAGYAQVQVGALSIQVLDFGLGDAGRHGAVAYPADGASGLPRAFTGSEVPDPLSGVRYPVGYPITVQAGSSSTLQVASANLRGAAGTTPVYVIPPGSDALMRNEFAMVPRQPLAAGSYTATVEGTLDGQPLHLSWQFSVG